MEKTIGFIGCGNMATAMIQGLINAGVNADEIIASNRSLEKLVAVQNSYGIHVGSNEDVATRAKWLVLAVKPKDIKSVLTDVKPYLSIDTVVISLAAGVTLENIEELLPESTKVMRMMPNTAVAINQAVIAIVSGKNVSAIDLAEAREFFGKLGLILPIDEAKMHGEIGLSGSAIAMFYLMADAMGDAGVKLGFTKSEAILIAATTMASAGEMILRSGKHPIQLKDEVCSPGGTTIEMIRNLEANGFRNTILEGVLAAAVKSKELSEGK